MKKITKQFLFSVLSLSAITFVSCTKDDATGQSQLEVATGVNATVNLNAPLAASQTINEGDDVSYTFTVNLDKPQSKDVHFKVIQIAGTADSDDFTAEEVVIPAYATSASGKITFVNDCTPESTETLTLQIGDITTANANSTPRTLSFTINNFLSDSLDLTFNYNKSFTIAGNPFSLYGIWYDIDFYLLDSSFADTQIYDAASANPPGSEHLTIDPTLALPDGTYYIFYDIYDTGDLNSSTYAGPWLNTTNTAIDGLNRFLHDPFTIPISVDYERCGSINPGKFNQESQFAPKTSVAGGYQNTNGNFVVQIDIVNGVYTLSNSLPQVIATGRYANNIAATIAQARRNNGK
jgi:hypothetical protein